MRSRRRAGRIRSGIDSWFPGFRLHPLFRNIIQHLVESRVPREQLRRRRAGFLRGEAGVLREEDDVTRDVSREVQAAFVADAVADRQVGPRACA